MLIERPPKIFRAFFPGALFRMSGKRREVMLTFDDGPIPEATPEILDILDRYGIRATFFMVGDNVRKYPEIFEEVKRRGHCIGNHSMHHVQGLLCRTRNYMADIAAADALIGSPYYRPPHGLLRLPQRWRLKKKYRLVMYDLVTRDYSKKINAARVLRNVRRLTRPGAVIVFHDSLRSIEKLREILPEALEWIIAQGYSFVTPEEYFSRK